MVKLPGRKLKSKVFISLALIGVFIISAVLYISWFKNRFTSYEDVVAGFKVKYPHRWSKKVNINGAAVLIYAPKENELDIWHESVNVVIQDISQNPKTLQEYSETAINQIVVIFEDQIEILESTPARLSGQEGHKIIYLAKGPEVTFKYMHIWTIRDYKAYQFTYMAIASQYDVYIDKVMRMARSFKIL